MPKANRATCPRKKSKEQEEHEAALKRLKMEVAEELGLAEKLRQVGWGGLSAAECGKIGGRIGGQLARKTNAPEKSGVHD